MSAEADRIEKDLEADLEAALQELADAQNPEGAQKVRVKYLGRKGGLTEKFSVLKDPNLTGSDKVRVGKKINQIKAQLEKALSAAGTGAAKPKASKSANLDLTLPEVPPEVGRLHPITQTVDEIVTLFKTLGFAVVQGPEVETEENNFEALNIPANHPSRESLDTYYLEPQTQEEEPEKWLLRSHTSPVQIRFMKTHKPPFRIVVPGRVFRRDAVDASHCFQFHQVEGLAVGRELTFGDLKGVLNGWVKQMFGRTAKLRFRPHFFPFTEPSAEADLYCIFCKGKGCRVCGQNGWLEILGCGLVHPNVFKAVGYPNGSVGFAFGMGVERIAMLKYGIEDIRLFFDNDMRFLGQFH